MRRVGQGETAGVEVMMAFRREQDDTDFSLGARLSVIAPQVRRIANNTLATTGGGSKPRERLDSVQKICRFPDNGWSLYGLATALRAQGREDEAADVEADFKQVWKTADVDLTDL